MRGARQGGYARLFGCLALLQGCASVTYLAPQLAGPATTRPSATVAGFAEMLAMCPNTLRGATRQRLAFSLDDGVAVCVASPITGQTSTPANPGLRFDQYCTRGALGGPRAASPTIVRVLIASKSDRLDVAHATATLRVADASWISLGDADQFRLSAGPTGYRLRFSFSRPCDPDAPGTLSIAGITRDRRALDLPPIALVPVTETVSHFD